MIAHIAFSIIGLKPEMFSRQNLDQLNTWSFGYKILMINVIAFVMRVKYYNGFLLGQLAIDASGLSYESTKGDYSRWVSIYPFFIELNQQAMLRINVRLNMFNLS